ncbi:amino acid adenylation domain-containing protein [Sorangium sp. So ce131]|uniref:amino acid adenylation domain-containing protein n=1 Tax=Sorangium sp. So ce131 TaxID=3133282 RepID=UPI003F60033B
MDADLKARIAKLSPEKRAELLRRLGQREAELPVATWRELVRGPGAGDPFAPRPVAHGQRRMWFLHQMDPDKGHYTNAIALWIDGDLDHARFRSVIHALVARHAMLRTVFRQQGDDILQIVLPELRVEVPLRDLSAAPAREQLARSDALAKAQRSIPFDLERAPLIRFELHRLGADRHRLTLVYHHIIADTWSLELFMREFVQAYLSGTTALAPLRFSYADFAEWQRRPEVEAEHQKQLAYWVSRLRDHAAEDTPIDLPADRPRAPEQSFRGGTLVFDVPSETTSRLRQLASSLGVSSFAVALSAFRVLLARYGAGGSSTAIGVPVSGRGHSTVRDIFGFFVNTIVLLSAVDEDASVRSNVLRESEGALAALEHQDVPFEMVVEALNPRRSLSQAPLFQVMFSYENVPEEKRRTDALSFRAEKLDGGTSIFDLVLSVHDAANGLSGDLAYAADLFDASTAELIVQHYLTVLSALVADPSRPLRDVSHVSESERHRLVTAMHGRSYPVHDAPFVDRIFSCAERSPRACAFVHGSTRTDYGTLVDLVEELAAGLRGVGLEAEDRVALMLPRGLELLVSLLATHRAGGAFVAIDPGLPALRRERLLDLSGARFCISTADRPGGAPAAAPDLESRALAGRTRFFTYDELRARGVDRSPGRDAGPGRAAGGASGARPACSSRGLAYVLFTSGSTGEPKGAMVEHGGMVNHLLAKIEDLGITEGDVVAQTAGLSFDIFVWQLLAALGAGGITVVYDDDVVRDPDAQLRALADDRVTIFQIVPSYLGALLDVIDGLESPPALPLRAVSVTGEAVQPRLCARFLERFPEVRLLNAYGPTECSDDITHHWILPEDTRGLRVPIGRPIHNATLYVVDDRMRLSGIGVPGELLAGGLPVGRGYLGDPDRTASSFVRDPFAAEPSARVYRTGDVARVRPDGIIEFLGRRDHQVKLRGHRIELGEIDSVLCSLPAVREAATVLVKPERAQPRLISFVVSSDSAGGGIDVAAALRAELAQRLTAAMVPSQIVAVDALPLTRSGKVDRNELERRGLGLDFVGPGAATVEEPRTSREIAVQEVFSAVLGAPSVGRADNFFDLGGDSISSLQVVARLRQRGFRVSARNIFQHQTVAALAAHLEEADRRSTAAFQVGEVPLSPLQERFFATPGEGLDHWNLGVHVQLARELELHELAAASEILLRAHPMLRARFEPRAGGFTQTVEEHGRVAVLCVPGPSAGGVERLCREISLSGPKLALGLVEGRSDEVMVVAHHLVTDAVSLQIIVEDLLSAIEGGREVLPEVTSFADWLHALRSVAGSPAFADEEAFWAEAIRRAFPADEIPVDHEAVQDYEGARAHLARSFDRATTQKLLDRLRDVFRIQPLEALVAALAESLSGWMPRERITMALEGHGRDELDERVDLSRSVGWFTAVYPVTLEITDDRAQRIRAAKQAVRAVTRGGAGFTGFEAAEMRRGREPWRLGVTLNYLGDLDRNAGNHALLRSVEPLITGLRAPERGPMELLDVAGYLSGGRLHIVIGHGARHDPSTIQGILDRMFDELERLADEDALQGANVVVASDFSATALSEDDLAALREHLQLVT